MLRTYKNNISWLKEHIYQYVTYIYRICQRFWLFHFMCGPSHCFCMARPYNLHFLIIFSFVLLLLDCLIFVLFWYIFAFCFAFNKTNQKIASYNQIWHWALMGVEQKLDRFLFFIYFIHSFTYLLFISSLGITWLISTILTMNFL